MTTIEQIKAQIKNVKEIQYNASRMNRSSAVFKCNRELDKLYKQLREAEKQNPR